VKKFFLPMLSAYSRTEFPNRRGNPSLQVTQGVDAESIDVEPGDHILVRANQELLQLHNVRPELLQRGKIADRVVARSRKTLPAVKGIVVKLAGPYQSIHRWAGYGGDVGPVRTRIPARVTPLDSACGGPEARFGALGLLAVLFSRIAHVGKHVPGVVQHDIQDHVQVQLVRRVDQ
jgi:hypothetical protein